MSCRLSAINSGSKTWPFPQTLSCQNDYQNLGPPEFCAFEIQRIQQSNSPNVNGNHAKKTQKTTMSGEKKTRTDFFRLRLLSESEEIKNKTTRPDLSHGNKHSFHSILAV